MIRAARVALWTNLLGRAGVEDGNSTVSTDARKSNKGNLKISRKTATREHQPYGHSLEEDKNI